MGCSVQRRSTDFIVLPRTPISCPIGSTLGPAGLSSPVALDVVSECLLSAPPRAVHRWGLERRQRLRICWWNWTSLSSFCWRDRSCFQPTLDQSWVHRKSPVCLPTLEKWKRVLYWRTLGLLIIWTEKTLPNLSRDLPCEIRGLSIPEWPESSLLDKFPLFLPNAKCPRVHQWGFKWWVESPRNFRTEVLWEKPSSSQGLLHEFRCCRSNRIHFWIQSIRPRNESEHCSCWESRWCWKECCSSTSGPQRSLETHRKNHIPMHKGWSCQRPSSLVEPTTSSFRPKREDSQSGGSTDGRGSRGCWESTYEVFRRRIALEKWLPR